MSELEKKFEEHEHECGCEHKHAHEHECGCEHEHGHAHEHECGCGHEHEHEHKCGCGHEHEHEHECGCGHDHEHEHTVPGYKVFDLHVHEGATVCSFEKNIKSASSGEYPEIREAFTGIRDWLKEKGAIIGHVKGYVRENGKATTFSTVGGELNVMAHDASGAVLGFAAIVFGVSEEELEEKVIETFSGIQ